MKRVGVCRMAETSEMGVRMKSASLAWFGQWIGWDVCTFGRGSGEFGIVNLGSSHPFELAVEARIFLLLMHLSGYLSYRAHEFKTAEKDGDPKDVGLAQA